MTNRAADSIQDLSRGGGGEGSDLQETAARVCAGTSINCTAALLGFGKSDVLLNFEGITNATVNLQSRPIQPCTQIVPPALRLLPNGRTVTLNVHTSVY